MGQEYKLKGEEIGNGGVFVLIRLVYFTPEFDYVVVYLSLSFLQVVAFVVEVSNHKQ